EFADQEMNGIYNVQFLTFRRDERGLAALNWWHDRCIEWCYYRLEDGKLGDQKYLDDWPERFEGVHVLRHKGGGLAPWNITQSDVRGSDGRVLVDDDPLVFFHYHRVRLLDDGRYDWAPPGYRITRRNRRLVYDPYLGALDEARAIVRDVDPEFRAGLAPGLTRQERLHQRRLELGALAAEQLPWLVRLRHPRLLSRERG